MEIRPIRRDEAAAAGTLVVEAYRVLLGPALDDHYAAELVDVAGRMEASEVLVAVRHRAIVGHVAYVADDSSPLAEGLRPGEAEIRMLAVAPRAQGAGDGRALVVECVERAARAGRSAVFLHSTPQMLTAHHLYASPGFVRQPERDWEPAPGVTLLAFGRPLAAGAH